MKNPLIALKHFLAQSTRVWKVTKKPNMKEFATIAKVSAIGILLIGFLGFIISVVMNLLVK